MIGSLRCSSHSSNFVCFLPKNVIFASWVIDSSSLSLAAFVTQRAFAFRLSLGFLVCCLTFLSVMKVPPFHKGIAGNEFLCRLLGRKRVSPHQPAAVPFRFPQCPDSQCQIICSCHFHVISRQSHLCLTSKSVCHSHLFSCVGRGYEITVVVLGATPFHPSSSFLVVVRLTPTI